MFDPSLGRWLTEDPIGFDAGDNNFYRFVGNSPTNFTDPSGLQYGPRGEPGAGGFLSGVGLMPSQPPVAPPSPPSTIDGYGPTNGAMLLMIAGMPCGVQAIADGQSNFRTQAEAFAGRVKNMYPNTQGYSQG